jgi:DNA-binding HxlR family transcriptional regulator
MSSSQATENKPGTPGRRAAELPSFCPLYHRAVELIGRRWTGVIIRALCTGSRRFNELLVAIPGLSDRLLTERLRELEREGVVRREVAPGPPVRVAYALTDRGAELEPVIHRIADWAERWMHSQEARGPAGRRARRPPRRAAAVSG